MLMRTERRVVRRKHKEHPASRLDEFHHISERGLGLVQMLDHIAHCHKIEMLVPAIRYWVGGDIMNCELGLEAESIEGFAARIERRIANVDPEDFRCTFPC